MLYDPSDVDVDMFPTPPILVARDDSLMAELPDFGHNQYYFL